MGVLARLKARIGSSIPKSSADSDPPFVNKLGSVPFRLGVSGFPTLYLAYQPDSQNYFGAHPEYKELFRRFTLNNDKNNRGDWPRFWSLMLNLKYVLDTGVQGDFAELGVWRGNTAAVLAHFASLHQRQVHLFDTFEGFDERDFNGIDSDKHLKFADTSVEAVQAVIGENSIQACRFFKGWFPESASDQMNDSRYCAVSLDCDLYDPMRAGLEYFYPRLSRGGLLLLHDYSSGFWKGATRAIDEFCQETGEMIVLMPDKSGSAFVRKSQV